MVFPRMGGLLSHSYLPLGSSSLSVFPLLKDQIALGEEGTGRGRDSRAQAAYLGIISLEGCDWGTAESSTLRKSWLWLVG